jgi:tripartite-type tricarboxylate transporter receptor subunit TctC
MTRISDWSPRLIVLSAVSALMLAACSSSAPQSAAPAKQESKPAEAPAKSAPAPTVAAAAPAQKAAEPAQKAAEPAAKAPAAADNAAVADFYRGKTFQIIVAYDPGGLYDTWARILSRHMPKHIPGNPTVIVQNMPGAGGMRAMSHLYNAAPQDGTVMATFSGALPMNQVRGEPGVDWDGAKFNWIGVVSPTYFACLARSDTPRGVVEFGKLLNNKTSNPLVLGTTGTGNQAYDFPTLWSHLLGGDFKVVTGYGGNNAVRLAIESKELDGYCGTWEAMKPGTLSWKDAGIPFTVFVQEADAKAPDLDAPLAHDFVTNAEDRKLFDAVSRPNAITRAYAMGPGVPAERVAAIEKAFLDSFKDPALLEEAKKGDFDVAPSGGKFVADRVKAILETEPAVLQRMKELIPTGS